MTKLELFKKVDIDGLDDSDGCSLKGITGSDGCPFGNEKYCWQVFKKEYKLYLKVKQWKELKD